MIAFAKLQELLSGRPIVFRGQNGRELGDPPRGSRLSGSR